MNKLSMFTGSAVAFVMAGTLMAPAAGAATVSSSAAPQSISVAASKYKPSKYKQRYTTKTVCRREVVRERHHRKHVRTVCHKVRVPVRNHR